MYQKERHEFGRAVNHFVLSEISILDEFVQDQTNPSLAHIERNPTVLDVQASNQKSETYVRACREPRATIHHAPRAVG